MIANQTPGYVGDAELAAYNWDIGAFSTLYPNQCFSDAAMTTPCVDGSPVYTWKNRTSGGTLGNLIQASGGNQPTFRHGDLSNTLAGLPCIDFNTDDLLGSVFTGRSIATFSMFMLACFGYTGSGNPRWGSVETALGTQVFDLLVSGDYILWNKSSGGGAGVAQYTAGNASKLVLLEFHYNTTERNFAINANSPGFNDLTSGAITWTGLTLGGRRNGSNVPFDQFPRLRVCELYITSDLAAYTNRSTLRSVFRERARLTTGYAHF